MKRKLLIFLMLAGAFCTVKSYSQSLSPVVISSSGGFASGANVSLSYTIAEMTMVQTFSSSGNILTQGFQQPESIVASVPESPVVSGDVLIYPNPTSGNFTLSYLSSDNAETNINLYNLTGQIVLTKKAPPSNVRNTVNFDISNFSQGVYILALPLENKQGEKKTVYQKINLIY